MIIRYLEVAIVWCKLWSLGELCSEGVDKVGHQAGGRVVSLAAVESNMKDKYQHTTWQKWYPTN